MDENVASVPMDFAENYSFHVQDQAQGHHWTHQTCNVQPTVRYCKTEEDKLKYSGLFSC